MRFYPEAHQVRALIIAQNGGRGRPPLPVSSIHTIMARKNWGDTDQQVAEAVGCSIPSVRRYAAGIAGIRRRDQWDAKNRKTGQVKLMKRLYHCKV